MLSVESGPQALPKVLKYSNCCANMELTKLLIWTHETGITLDSKSTAGFNSFFESLFWSLKT